MTRACLGVAQMVVAVMGLVASREAWATPSGKVEPVSASGRVRGWARDPGTGAFPNPSIQVDLYVDFRPTPPTYPGSLPRVNANQPSAEINVAYPADPGNHAFSAQIPAQYFDGVQHTLYAYAIGTSSNAEMTGSGLLFTLPKNPVIGGINAPVLDTAGNLKVTGWACQVGVNASIPVSVYAGASAYFSDGSPLSGTPVTSTFTSSSSASSVVSQCKPTNGFSTYNFEITVTAAARRRYQGLPLFVHGLRVTGTSQNAALSGSGDFNFPLDPVLGGKLLEGVPSAYVTPAMLENLLADPSLTTTALWTKIKGFADAAPATASPYFGTDYQQFQTQANDDLANLPYVAMACQVLGGCYCTKGVRVLNAWATAVAPEGSIDAACVTKSPAPLHAGVQLYCPKGTSADDDPAIQAGLTIGRYMGQIVESYQLLAKYMDAGDPTNAQKTAIVSWIRELGYTIKKSSLSWNARVAADPYSLVLEGPNNHLQWHNYGMALAGLVSKDNDLVTYALTDPANRQTESGVNYARNYFGLVTDSIREVGNVSNIFYAPYETASSPLRTGEIWDRYRHSTPRSGGGLENHGFAYSSFALLPMTYTAHWAQINGLTNNLASFMSFVDPRGPLTTPSIPNALRCYADMLVEAVPTYTPNPSLISYAPYAGENACAAARGAFAIGKRYLPVEDQALLAQAFSVCRQKLPPGDPAYFDGDIYPLDGITQLYLMLANGGH